MSSSTNVIGNPLSKALSVSGVASAGAGAGGAGAGSSAPVHIINPLAAASAASAGPRPPSYPRPSPRAEDVLDGDALRALLLDACKMGDRNMALDIIATGMVNLKDKDTRANTPLMLASDRGLTDVVKALLAKGVDVNAQNIGGYTSLMFACKKGRMDTVNALLAAGANVTLTNNGGNTAFQQSSPEMQAFLRTKGITKGGKRSQTNRKRLRSKKRRSVRKMKRTYRR